MHYLRTLHILTTNTNICPHEVLGLLHGQPRGKVDEMAQRANNGQKARGKNGKPTDAVIVSPGMDSFSGVTYQSTADIVADARTIIESAHDAARRSVNTTLVLRNWYLGKRIAEEELKGADRAEYGSRSSVISRKSSQNRMEKAMRGVTSTCFCRSTTCFLRLCTRCVHNLEALCRGHIIASFCALSMTTHVPGTREASEQGWSVRTLARNIGTKYYERLLLSGNKTPVEQEMRTKAAPYQTRAYRVAEFIKDPYVAEFLGFSPDAEARETDLESAILADLQKFLLEMGKGYAFMGRQYHLRGMSGDYYIDLVFYNVILKCYVLVDLKCGPVTHQDIGQMDMYVRMFDDKIRRADDNPTIGIVLTSETSADIARYSVLHDSDQLYASSYLLYLPSENELRQAIETEKQRFALRGGQTSEAGAIAR